MLDEQLLGRYIDTFYGYGTYRGRYWLVGMEEGGGSISEENFNRVSTWSTRGRRELEDLAAFHHGLGGTRYSGERPPLQATWSKLIRIVLACEGVETVTTEAVRSFQRDHLGRDDKDTALIELLPLPSPSAGHWAYGGLPSLPHLASREAYREYYARPRAQHIAGRVRDYQPPVVIFYSFDWWYRQWWDLIAGVQFSKERVGSQALLLGHNGQTVFAIVKHPATIGLSNDYFHQVGRLLASKQASVSQNAVSNSPGGGSEDGNQRADADPPQGRV